MKLLGFSFVVYLKIRSTNNPDSTAPNEDQYIVTTLQRGTLSRAAVFT
jgi:hypothetical protein